MFKNFVRSMLKEQADDRITAKECFNQKFISYHNKRLDRGMDFMFVL